MDELAFEMYAEKWFRPATLMKALKLKSSQPKSRWVMGNLSSGKYKKVAVLLSST